ncbi:MAG TPA: hypothetical protein VID47_12440 [Actinomycetota bacterium]|jgi:hypothetical protein
MELRRTVKDLTPHRALAWYRRRRELRIYFNELGDNLWLQRLQTLDAQRTGKPVPAEEAGGDATGQPAAWAIHDLVERNDIVLKAMERRIEALTARHGQQIRNLRDDVAALREQLDALRERLDAPAPGAAAPAE